MDMLLYILDVNIEDILSYILNVNIMHIMILYYMLAKIRNNFTLISFKLPYTNCRIQTNFFLIC